MQSSPSHIFLGVLTTLLSFINFSVYWLSEHSELYVTLLIVYDGTFREISFRWRLLVLTIFEKKLYHKCLTGTQLRLFEGSIPANIYILKVNNRNTRKRCELCSKLTIKTPEPCRWRRSSVFIVNFDHISYIFLLFLLLTLNK